MDDGTWRDIKVCEDFSQGCPLMPILAAIVLADILSQLEKLLKQCSDILKVRGNLLDDGQGGVTLIISYVDDANFLVTLEDVLYLLGNFRLLATPLGVIMNKEKARILTITRGSFTPPQLQQNNHIIHQ